MEKNNFNFETKETSKGVVFLRKGALATILTASLVFTPTVALANDGGGTIFDPTQGDYDSWSDEQKEEYNARIKEYLDWVNSLPVAVPETNNSNQTNTPPQSSSENSNSNSNSNNGQTNTSSNNSSSNKPKSSLSSLKELNEDVKDLGEYVQLGMEKKEYEKVIESEWEEVLLEGEPLNKNVYITSKYSYEQVEDIILNLGKYPNAKLSILGRTEEDTPIYVLEVGKEATTEEEKENQKYILSVAGLDGNDIAGTLFLLRQATEYLNGGCELDDYTYSFVFSANPDQLKKGLEFEETKTSDSKGIDPTISFPTKFAGFVLNDEENTYGQNSSEENYLGKNLGDSALTRALMSWIDKRIENAAIFINYDKSELKVSTPEGVDPVLFSKFVSCLKDESTNPDKNTYSSVVSNPVKGTITDYVNQLAEGYTFNEKTGRLDNDDEIKPVNEKLQIFTVGIGGYGYETYYINNRLKWIDLYSNNGFETLLVDIKETHKTLEENRAKLGDENAVTSPLRIQNYGVRAESYVEAMKAKTLTLSTNQ